jgi:hypothetical protein
VADVYLRELRAGRLQTLLPRAVTRQSPDEAQPALGVALAVALLAWLLGGACAVSRHSDYADSAGAPLVAEAVLYLAALVGLAAATALQCCLRARFPAAVAVVHASSALAAAAAGLGGARAARFPSDVADAGVWLCAAAAAVLLALGVWLASRFTAHVPGDSLAEYLREAHPRALFADGASSGASGEASERALLGGGALLLAEMARLQAENRALRGLDLPPPPSPQAPVAATPSVAALPAPAGDAAMGADADPAVEPQVESPALASAAPAPTLEEEPLEVPAAPSLWGAHEAAPEEAAELPDRDDHRIAGDDGAENVV